MSEKISITTISLTSELMNKIDEERGDVPRSRFLERLIEDGFKFRKIAAKKL